MAVRDGSCRTKPYRKYDAPSARELPASEGEQAADDASMSRAPPPAMAMAGVGGLQERVPRAHFFGLAS